MQYVGVGMRLVALIIDSIILFIVGYILAAIFGQTNEGGAGFNLQGGPAVLWFIIILAYYVVMEVQMGGTAGKLALGMRVVKMDGSAVDW